MKLTKTEILKYLNFLNRYKGSVGFAGWKVYLTDIVEENDSIARIRANIHEKELQVYLFTEFLDLPDEKQRETLFHELVHARILYYHALTDLTTRFFEEDLVNDLVRGFGDLKWDKKQKSKNT